MPYAVVLGIAAGLLEFIPLAGPLAIGVVATGFAAFHSLGQAVAVLLFLLALRAVQDYVVYPKIVGKGVHLIPWASSWPSCAARSSAAWRASFSRSLPLRFSHWRTGTIATTGLRKPRASRRRSPGRQDEVIGIGGL